MRELSHILIANDSLTGLETALAKAAVLEHYSGAELELAIVIYDTIAEEPDVMLPAEQQAQLIEGLKAAERNGLRRLLMPIEGKVASIEPRVIWSKEAAPGLLSEAGSIGAELIIKPVSEHSQLGDMLHTPLDWALMRNAECAVLISKARAWDNARHVLAAVDVADAEHGALTSEVLQTAAYLARLLGTDLHVVAAYPSLGQSVDELQVALDYDGIKRDMKQSRQKGLDDGIKDLELGNGAISVTTHVLEGKPAVVIPKLANDLDATLTVLGTAARKGLSKMVFGNTSEAIIGRLQCDVVTVRESH